MKEKKAFAENLYQILAALFRMSGLERRGWMGEVGWERVEVRFWKLDVRSWRVEVRRCDRF